MKKRLICLLTILLSVFLFTNNALAKKVTSKVDTQGSSLKWNYGHWEVGYTYLTFDGNSKDTAYCLNPGYTTVAVGGTCTGSVATGELANAVSNSITSLFFPLLFLL